MGGAGGMDPGRDRSADLVDAGADCDSAGATRDSIDLGRAHAAERGQVRPLVIVWFHRRQIEERRRAVLAGLALQRCGDQIPHAARGQHVL